MKLEQIVLYNTDTTHMMNDLSVLSDWYRFDSKGQLLVSSC
jgi:hypothetical protein